VLVSSTADFETKVRTHLAKVILTWRDVRPAEKDARRRPRAKRNVPTQDRHEHNWNTSLRSGELVVTLRGGVGRDSQALLSHLRDVMEELGYRRDTAERVEVCFIELLETPRTTPAA
jgi:hypothetical protein